MNITCPNCQTNYRNISEKFMNRLVTCKKCQYRFKVEDTEVHSRAPQETILEKSEPQDKEQEKGPQETMLAEVNSNTTPQETIQASPISSDSQSEAPQETQIASPGSVEEGESSTIDITEIEYPQESLVSETIGAGSERFIAEQQGRTHSQNNWRIGDVLLDLYELKSVLGEGQFGKVYLVRHRGWNMDLALKAPKQKALSAGSENIEKEAETWVNLELHPNIVNCYYVRRIDGVPQIFSEYVDGGDLKELITSKKLYQGDDKAVLLRILDIAIQFAWGLHYAHEQGLIHQDIKPANVMVTQEGVIKVTDFGLAKAGAMANISGQKKDQTMVIAGMGMTPAYASPEQLSGKQLTRRTDLWSWGVCILEMILGYCSWEAGAVAPGIFEAYQEGALDEEPAIQSLPETMAELLEDCFEEDEDKRPNNLQEIAELLIAVYQDQSDQVYPRQQPKEGSGRVSSMNNQAISLLDLGRTNEALKLWESALLIDPRHYESHYNHILYAWKNSGLEESKVLAKIERYSNKERYYAPLSRLYLQFGHYDKAIDVINGSEHKLNQLDLDNKEGSCKELGLALCARYRLLKEGELWRPIVDCLKKAVGGKITDPYVITAYTVALQRLGERKEASRFFKAASSVGVIPQQLKQAVSLFLPGYEILYRLKQKNINHVQFVDNGENLLFCQTNRLVVWSLKDNKMLRQMEGHVGTITTFVLSADRHRVISGSQQGEIRCWDYETGEILSVWSAHKGKINALDISPCGQYLVSASEEKTIYLWDTQNGNRLNDFYGQGHDRDIMDVCFSVSGNYIASGSKDKIIRIWDTKTGRTQKILSGHDMSITCIHWLDDDHIASGSHDKTIRIWDIATTDCEKILKSHTGTINCLGAAVKNGYLISGSSDATIRYWNLNTGSSSVLSQLPDPIKAVAIDCSEQFMLSLSGAGIALLETENPFRYQATYLFSEPESATEVNKLQKEYQTRLSDALTAKGKNDALLLMEHLTQARAIKGYERDYSAFKHWSELYLLLPKSRLKDVWKLAELETHNKRITALAVSPINRQLYSASQDGFVLKWNIENRQSMVSFSEQQPVSVIEITNEGNAILVAYGHNIQMLDIKNGHKMSIFSHHQGQVRALAVTADGRFALSSDDKGAFYLWRLLTGELMADFTNEKYIVTTLAVTPDGRYVVTGHRNNNKLCLWDMENGKVISELDEHEKVVTSVSVSSDGRYILSGSADATIRLWQIQSSHKKSVRVLRGHSKRIHQVTQDSQNKIAMSVSEDYSVRIWDLINGECLHSFETVDTEFTSVAISPNGQYGFAGDNNGTVSVWCLDWLMNKKTYQEWDKSADIYMLNYLSSHSVSEPHKSLTAIIRLLKNTGYGWLEKNEIGMRWLELSQAKKAKVLPGSKFTRSQNIESQSSLKKKPMFLGIVASIVGLFLASLLFKNSGDDNTSAKNEEAIKTIEITDSIEQKTVEKMLDIAMQLALLNKNVLIVNNRIDKSSIRVPYTIEQLTRMLNLENESLIDAWGQPFRYQGVKLGGLSGRIVLRSAGVDKLYKTDDDLLLNGYPYWDSLMIRKNGQLVTRLASQRTIPLSQDDMETEIEAVSEDQDTDNEEAETSFEGFSEDNYSDSEDEMVNETEEHTFPKAVEIKTSPKIFIGEEE